MRVSFVSRAALISAAAALFCPASLARAAGLVPVGPPVIVSCAVAPSLAQCQTPSYLAKCGDALCVNVFAQNKPTLASQQAAAQAALPQASVLASDGGIETAFGQPYANALKVTVAPNTFEGKSLPFWLASQTANANLAAASVMKHQGWHDDGTVVNSCAEFVAQQYWDYELFNDTAKSLGTDYWSIVRAAFSPAAPGIGNGRTLYELGTGQPQYNQLKNGIVLGQFGNRHPKNAFFMNDWTTLNFTGSQYSGTQIPSWVPADLQAALSTPASYSYSSEMSWHQQMAAAHGLNGAAPLYTQAQYDQINMRVARFASLMSKLYDAGAQEAVLLYEAQTANTPCIQSTPNGPCEIAVATGGGGFVSVVPPLNLAAYSVARFVPPGMYEPTAETSDESWVLAYSTSKTPRSPALAAKELAANVLNAELQSGTPLPLAQARQSRALWEYLVMRYLLTEWDLPGHGCLGVWNSTACDWSPRLFARSWVNYFSPLEASLYRSCVAATGDYFPAVHNTDPKDCTKRRKQDYWFPPLPSTLPLATPWYQKDYGGSTHDVTTFEATYQNRADLWKSYDSNELAVEQEVNSMPVDPTIGGFSHQTSDSGSLGDSATFTGDYAYSAKWDVENAGTTTISSGESRICRLNGHMSASLSADAGAFGFSKPVLDVQYSAAGTDQLTEMKSHFTVLGTDLYAGDVTTGSHYGTFTQTAPVGSTDLGQQDIADQWIVVAGIVPVHLTVSIAATASAEQSMSVNNPQACARSVTFSLHGGVTPSVKADLVGEASIDILIADAGVRADLNLVTLSMPFTMGIDVSPSGATARQVTFNENLSADADELGGSVAVFADLNYLVGSQHFSKTLFSWDGFHQHMSLWNPPTQSFDLDALSVRLYSGAILAGGQPPYASCPVNPVLPIGVTTGGAQ